MKIAKRILVGILAITVLVSCFAFAASAEDVTVIDESVLEYYEQIFDISRDIDSVTAGAAYPDANVTFIGTVNGQKITVEEDGSSGKYISIYGGASNTNTFLKWTSDNAVNGVFLQFDINALVNVDQSAKCTTRRCSPKASDGALVNGGTCPKCKKGTLTVTTQEFAPVVNVMLGDTVEGTELADRNSTNTVGTSLLVFDMQEKKLNYTELVEGEPTVKTVEGLTLDGEEWYTVNIAYNAKLMEYTFTVTEKSTATEVAHVQSIPAAYSSVRTIKIGTAKDKNNKGTTVKLDNITSQGGTFLRDDTQKQEKSDEAAVYYANLANTATDFETKLRAYDLYSRMVTLGYNPVSEEGKAAEKNIGFSALNVVKEYTGAINSNAAYAQRLENLEKYRPFYASLPTDLTIYSAQEIPAFEQAKAAFESEMNALNEIKVQTLGFIEALSSVDISSNVYGELKFVYNYSKFDATVEGAGDYLDEYVAFKSKADGIVAAAELFITRVNAAVIVNNTAPFAQRYQNYAAAKADRFTDTTYDTIASALALYAELELAYSAIENTCESFINYVEAAKLNTKYNSIASSLSLAAAESVKTTFEQNFPGVAQAMAEYNALLVNNTNKKNAADAYVAAVNALTGLTGDALINAIAAAEALQTAGNIDGYEPATIANQILSNYKNAVALTNGYSNKFVELVGALADADTLAEKFSAIYNALSVNKAYINAAHPGVQMAQTALAVAVAEYNAQIAGINEEFSGVKPAASPAVSADFIIPKDETEKLLAIMERDAVLA